MKQINNINNLISRGKRKEKCINIWVKRERTDAYLQGTLIWLDDYILRA